MSNQHPYDVIVIGGGPAGMMAALSAADEGHDVLILEKNAKLGKKLGITGGGRCNITNATFNNHELLKVYGDAAKFLHSPFARFGVQDTFDFFEKNGLPLVTEARNRVFPESQKAHDVVKTLERLIRQKRIHVETKAAVAKIHRKSDGSGMIDAVTDTNGARYTGQHFIIATGGNSYPETGSTGDGFKWLKNLGHTVRSSSPNIVPLSVSDEWVHELSGTSLSFMKINFYLDGKKKFSKTGKLLFTHFGLSGPLILNSAKEVSELLHEGTVTATIDCYPDTDLGSLDKQILKIFNDNKNKSFKNVVKDIVPHGLSNTIIGFHIVPDVENKVHSISKEERKEIVSLLKALPLTVDGLMGMDRAVISDGGVPLNEVDTKTMQSRVIPNLFLTGDILNINRPSGGYSLQLCWTTGFVAGKIGKKD